MLGIYWGVLGIYWSVLGIDWSVLSIDWSVGNSDAGGLSNGNSDLSWGSVDNSVESVDGISGVSDGSDGTIGLNKGVFSLDDISVTGFVLVLLVSGQSIGNGVSEVVLWMGVEWLGGNGLNDLWGMVDLWGNGVSNWLSNGMSNSSISDLTGISESAGVSESSG